MEAVPVLDNSMSDQFHDCNSQPTSPRPKPTAEHVTETGDVTEHGSKSISVAVSSESTPALSGESSKENSPRPESASTVPVSNGTTSSIDKKLKKREDKNMDYVLRALSALTTPEEKLAALCKKYTDLLDENRHHASAVKSGSKKLSQISRERDSLQTENSKLILAKSKLESLCRELQRHNKVVKEESLARQREEEERRKEVSSRFQTTISDIQTQMESHSKRNDKLQEDNKELSSKLHTLLEQYEKREEHIQKLLHQKDLESQLLEAKLSQCQLMVEKEQEKNGVEKHMLLEKLIESKTTQETMAQTEVHLKTQLQIYTQKYSEFESTLNKSNEVFASFKSEMEKMSKKIRKLEKESQMYKQRWENTNGALLEMVEQKTLREKLIDKQAKKNKQLESLCRALQNRTAGGSMGNSKPEEDSCADSEATDVANGCRNTGNGSSNPQVASHEQCAEPLDSSNRPQAIGQSSDEQETASENDKTDTSPGADTESIGKDNTEVAEEVTNKLLDLAVTTESEDQSAAETAVEEEETTPEPASEA